MPSAEHPADEAAPSGAAPRVLALAGIVAIVAVTSYLGFSTDRAGEKSFWLLAGGPVLLLTPIALYRAWKDGQLAGWMRPKAGDFSLGFLGAGVLFSLAYAFSRLVTPSGSPRAIWLARLYLQLGDPGVLPRPLVGALRVPSSRCRPPRRSSGEVSRRRSSPR